MPSFYVRLGSVEWCLRSSDQKLPDDMRAFDSFKSFRENKPLSVHLLFINDNIQLMVAIDYLLERGWELDLSRCCSQFLSLYGVEAAA